MGTSSPAAHRRALVREVRRVGVAGRARRHDPAAGVPVRQVEHVAGDRRARHAEAEARRVRGGEDGVPLPAHLDRRWVEPAAPFRVHARQRVRGRRPVQRAPPPRRRDRRRRRCAGSRRPARARRRARPATSGRAGGAAGRRPRAARGARPTAAARPAGTSPGARRGRACGATRGRGGARRPCRRRRARPRRPRRPAESASITRSHVRSSSSAARSNRSSGSSCTSRSTQRSAPSERRSRCTAAMSSTVAALQGRDPLGDAPGPVGTRIVEAQVVRVVGPDDALVRGDDGPERRIHDLRADRRGPRRRPTRARRSSPGPGPTRSPVERTGMRPTVRYAMWPSTSALTKLFTGSTHARITSSSSSTEPARSIGTTTASPVLGSAIAVERIAIAQPGRRVAEHHRPVVGLVAVDLDRRRRRGPARPRAGARRRANRRRTRIGTRRRARSARRRGPGSRPARW